MKIEEFNNPLYNQPTYQIKTKDENLEEIALCFKEQYPNHIASCINTKSYIQIEIMLIGLNFKDIKE